MKKRTQVICEEREGDRHVKRYPSQCRFFLFFSHSTLAICSKSHHSWVVITEVLTEEILFHFWLLSAALILCYFPTGFMSFGSFHTPFFVSSICDEGLMPSNQLYFFWKKKSQSELMVYFIDKSIPPYSQQNPQNISAQCGRICQLMKCQSSIMEK